MLYNKGASVLLKCTAREDEAGLLKEMHAGLCGNHLTPRSTATKGLRQGFYWPMMVHHIISLLRRCESCQKMVKSANTHVSMLKNILITWPFARLGLDLLRPFSPAKGGRKYVVAAIDYFTNWVKDEPLTTITS